MIVATVRARWIPGGAVLLPESVFEDATVLSDAATYRDADVIEGGVPQATYTVQAVAQAPWAAA